ncbi:ATP-binding cassette domain-containing protein [Paracoccus sp. P2]|uniref:ATP-binding cassette domain-containing protein n=1 Tax=Paracoccus pantotrophus TaxID=82367 RepID=A0A1I5GZ92_PARPN|nr:branched-chain amino acid ABC transporter ATP-binding protein/permease [Paracoccus pantotrophus]MDF3854488.1 branched-chain amino acid ABC transporter ATP-binding protein/permease [Paracoccus pantotrophus]QFG38381.1 ATP-binding cassette domain-containing protein [Paracoccus pantotrophus]QLH15934.1 ATP-binding cassette domain-containing protein [Paracoccus pantotrophus]RDD98866.1 ATP-binding cassette domain-containing protein [Paracoccus pantotrophus]RKS51100.1 amino acid/amide ABC transport
MTSQKFLAVKNLLIVALALVVLPVLLSRIGLGANSAVEVVIFALAAMGLNVLVGYTGLVSFGHGIWFGTAAYVAGLTARSLGNASMAVALIVAVAATALVAALVGFLVLRRRGVYFSLMTLALSAMGFQLAFRWTDVTGGENGLGGIERPALLDNNLNFYVFVALLGFAVIVLLQRVLQSPFGSVLEAIRENDGRAQALGYDVRRYKLKAFVLSAVITGLAGALLLYKNRMTSAEPMSIIFSGELLAMVVIGGMRGYLGPALGALFYILFREYLSMYTENWLLWFGLIFLGFVIFARQGMIGIGAQFRRRFFPEPEIGAAMADRRTGDYPLPRAIAGRDGGGGDVLVAEGISKNFRAIKAVDDVSLRVRDRTLHALLGPNGAGKTTAFNLMSGIVPTSAGRVSLLGQDISGQSADRISNLGLGRSFQITNLFPELTVRENIRLAVQARDPSRNSMLRSTASVAQVHEKVEEMINWVGLAGMENARAGSLSYGGQRLLDLGLALATEPRILLADEPLAGLSVAERERVGLLIKDVSKSLPVLLVEHDIDRVFELADHVTVMADGKVLVDGTVDDARNSREVRDIYIGSGTSAVAASARQGQFSAERILRLDKVNLHYGKSHILQDVSFDLHKGEILALLGRNGAGKSSVLKAVTGIVAPSSGSVGLMEHELAGLSSARIARLGIGYVPQGRGLFAGMTVRENLELGRIRRQTGEGTHWSLEEILEYFPRLRERLDTPADSMSGGEQQMAAVARALSGDIRVLLLDEPFEGLAPAVVEQLFRTFDKLRDRLSIVIVDHNLDLALALSDRTIVLERGRVLHEIESRRIAEDIELRREMLWM